jgi:two-component system, cell cycle sensor histidine kinase and response regulator CckA
MADSKQERPWQLLVADDNADDAELCLRELKKSDIPFVADVVSTREDFAKQLQQKSFDVVISDYNMGGWTGMDALTTLKSLCPEVPLILLTGTLGDQMAVDCIKMGVTDYVLKDQIGRLPLALHRAKEERALREAERRAAEALREGEEHYRILVENAPEAIIVCDVEEERFVDCNENAQQLYGVAREELLRHGPGDFAPPHQPDGRPSKAVGFEFIQKALSGERCSFEYVVRNSQGRDVPCEVHLIALPSHGRKLVRGSIIDITERKHAETALRESEARYRGLVDNATYGIYWEKPDGALVYANRALVHMLGYDSVEEFLALRTTGALYCNPSRGKTVQDSCARDGRVDAVVDWKRKDGRSITVRVNGRYAKNLDSESPCIEALVEDVTERNTLETQLLQSQKFEAIGQLAGGIAHDFNNMIGAILGWADMGIEETEPGARLRRHFEKMRHQAERAGALTRQLLAFARRQILEPRDIDFNQTVTETLSLLEKVIGSNIEIRSTLAADLPVVRADSTQLEQVLMNLCINARDAMPGGGLLVIETAKASFDEESCKLQPLAHPGDYAMLSVTDTGTGMDSATLDRMFEPFFTTKELGKGTGLGLATVYGIVRQHSGFVHVYSEPGLGTTLRVYLPVSGAAVASPVKPEDDPKVEGGTETLLVAEDHDGLRQLALETLTKLGYTVIAASDGEEAVRAFRSRRDDIDLALLDVVMPKLNGPEIYSRISAERPDLPVIFATGYSADFALLHKVQQQGLPVLQKPYTARALARKVREALDHHPAPRLP